MGNYPPNSYPPVNGFGVLRVDGFTLLTFNL